MTTLTLSSPKAMGFYSQSLQDKLYPFLGNGERLSLSDALDLSEIASSGAWWTNQTGEPYFLGQILQLHESNASEYAFDSFDCHSEIFQSIELDLEEWISLSRWSSELAELRHHDYKRATRQLTPSQLAAPWVD
ncbi:hypothetical protein [Laspinema olomoucense]|uniref:Uncharacterized protein n=1 Tax=Laspinema olomoucense D3b TaxID=2953688 RepID=A0ABT2NFR0_9CYAN|nr:hypothetical protein [Laspinema sp. D3b]MCT7981528.1 hypothetical protein [Laspinema sp. D3b]